MLKVVKWIVGIFLLAILAVIALFISPWGRCVDMMSGRVPTDAIQRFVQNEISRRILEKQSVDGITITSNYEIVFRDDLLRTYNVGIRFDKQYCIDMEIRGYWPSCPDFDVTEEEIRTTSRQS